MTSRFSFLDAYSIYLKIMSVISVIAGFVFIGLIIYAWGQLTAVYNMLRAAMAAVLEIDPDMFSAVQLPELPIWPLILLILVLVLSIITVALTLWAMGALIDLRLRLAEEERKTRDIRGKSLATMSRNIELVAAYFAGLPRPK